MAMATGFEWRSNNNDDGSTVLGSFNPAEGCLFACGRGSGSASNNNSPTLTLVPPSVSTDSCDAKNNGGISPAPGDDLSPPNAVQAHQMNGIAVPISASAGWSQSPPQQESVYPSSIAYDLRLKTANQSERDSLEMTVSLEYTNPHFDNHESMMVKAAVAKTLVQAEMSGTELTLVATQFQEYVTAKKAWVDITADVEYTQTANAVVDAVLKDPTAGQTAGKATVTAETVELTLGPFSAKARLNLTFQAERLYTYEAMSVQANASDIGSHRLLPLWVNLPFCPPDREEGLPQLSVRFQAPSGAHVLPIQQFAPAYHHLKQQPVMKATTILAVSELVPHQQQVGYEFLWGSLPPRSCGILTWLALPNPTPDEDAFDFVHIGHSLEEVSNSNKEQAQATIQVPQATDLANLQVPLPGHGPMGSLWRIQLKLPQAQSRNKPYLVLNLTLSDKSGSTAIRVSGSTTTMRQRFNDLAEVRFLRRLESIPDLVQAGVLRPDDVWMDVFLAFDSQAPSASIHRVVFCVSEVLESIAQVVEAIRSNQHTRIASLSGRCILDHVLALRGVQPGGLTDFSVGPRTLVQEFAKWQQEAQDLSRQTSCNTSQQTPEILVPCTFVEFDTDGGHNGSRDYLESLQHLCQSYQVRNGVVTGFGSWLNQDCASKVARILGSVPAQLALQIPEPGTEGLDKVFRRGFSAWVGALRQPPNLTVKLSAGCVAFFPPASQVLAPATPERMANAVEVIALRRTTERHERLPSFGAPDVSNETYTKAVIEGAPAGDELVLYVISRLQDASQLAQKLVIETSIDGSATTSSSTGRVWSKVPETSVGTFLGYNWLTMLTCSSRSEKKLCQIAPLMSTSLCSRLEDEISFRFNLASPSGRTSYLGRCKTVADRAPIDTPHQPKPPSTPLKVVPQFQQQQGQLGCFRPALAPPAHIAKLRMKREGQMKREMFKEASRIKTSGNRMERGSAFGNRTSGAPATQASAVASSGPASSFGISLSFLESKLPETMEQRLPETMEQRSASGNRTSGAPATQASSVASAAPASFFGSSLSYAPPSPSFASVRQAAAPFGAPAFKRSRKRQSLPPGPPKNSSPSWMDALAVPVGSDLPLSEQNSNMQTVIAVIAHARLCLLRDPSINFVCDVCSRNFALGEVRYHCFDCRDFDACSNCRECHNVPFHRIAPLSPTTTITAPSVAVAEDPLVDSLLKHKPGTVQSQRLSSRPIRDRTVEWCKNRVCRFLLAVLDWWPLFRASCTFCNRLPTSLEVDLAQKIAHACSNENRKSGGIDNNLQGIVNLLKVVTDSLTREEEAHRAAVSHTFGHERLPTRQGEPNSNQA